MKRTLLSLLALASLSLASAQTSVLPYTPGIHQEGITYYLPKTALSITLTAPRTNKRPGDFHQYAARYLRLTDVTAQEETTWTLDRVQVTPYGLPDTAKVYTVQLRKGTLAPLATLTKSGLLLSINDKSDEEPLPADPGIDKIEKSKLNPRDYMSQEILMAGSNAKMAELTAAEIYDIRDSRSQLSKGQADNMPKDGEQLKLMIQQLDTQEEALLQLFKGTVERETKSYTFTLIPAKSERKVILCRFSDQFGPVDKDNLAGEPVYIDIVDQKSVPSEQPGGKKKKLDEQAVRYNVPSDADIRVYTRENKLAQLTTPVAQFGHVEILSSDLFNKRTSTKVYFYQTTGGIKQIVDDAQGK